MFSSRSHLIIQARPLTPPIDAVSGSAESASVIADGDAAEAKSSDEGEDIGNLPDAVAVEDRDEDPDADGADLDDVFAGDAAPAAPPPRRSGLATEAALLDADSRKAAEREEKARLRREVAEAAAKAAAQKAKELGVSVTAKGSVKFTKAKHGMGLFACSPHIFTGPKPKIAAAAKIIEPLPPAGSAAGLATSFGFLLLPQGCHQQRHHGRRKQQRARLRRVRTFPFCFSFLCRVAKNAKAKGGPGGKAKAAREGDHRLAQASCSGQQ